MAPTKDVDRLGNRCKVPASRFAVPRAARPFACGNGFTVAAQRIQEGLATGDNLWWRRKGDPIAPGVEVRFSERFAGTPVTVLGRRPVLVGNVPDDVCTASDGCDEVSAELLLGKLYSLTPVAYPPRSVGQHRGPYADRCSNERANQRNHVHISLRMSACAVGAGSARYGRNVGIPPVAACTPRRSGLGEDAGAEEFE
ncbi:hypothetical protein [Streptomyces sp. NPDC050504]|uniref:hypothetical protein n=1 Tax=Streptomyces sp. NPDC050504 TaxID=3365618 RepID=UPI003792A619